MDKEMDIRKLDQESLDAISGGEKITYEEAWNTLPHADRQVCPYCGGMRTVYMGTCDDAAHRFDLVRCTGCRQRYVLER